MCGIAGLLNLSGKSLNDDISIASKMAEKLAHRGPDEAGSYSYGPVSFNFRRLSIIDLQTGNQPMSNEDSSIWGVFNGEIYNYLELRSQLISLGHCFQTTSDTEVIVHAYEAYGLDFVKQLRGMFAIAIWDANQGRLALLRDRLGKKPIYYRIENNQLAFASEVKAFLCWPHLDKSIDEKAVHDYLTYTFIPTPRTIFSNLHTLPPAHLLTADCNTGNISTQQYWKLIPNPDPTRSLDDYAEELRSALTEAVSIRLRSDVPLGAFLSGGVDSSVVVGVMSKLVSPVRTFSIRFNDPRFDESTFARLAAQTFGTQHTEEVVDEYTFEPDELTELVWFMDQPFADSSFIPTYWVSKIARKQVTVVLTGDGGDELFAGYPRYRHLHQIQQLARLPRSLRNLVINILGKSTSLSSGKSIQNHMRLRQVRKALEFSLRDSSDQLLALHTYFDEVDKSEMYQRDWLENLGGYRTRFCPPVDIVINKETNWLTKVLGCDLSTSLVDDSLVKVDRASMACSLELRSPFLDHKLVELAMNIPSPYKLHGREHKVVLKRAAQDLLPKTIQNRGKQGFEVPFASWFQQPHWRDFLVDHLSESRIQRQGIFAPQEVLTWRDAILTNPQAADLPISAYQLRHRVWMLLVFQIWYERFIG